MGFLLPMFLIYCCCISSLETTYLPCVTEMRVFASTRDFLRSSITFSLVFTRSAISWPSLFSSSISHFFSYKSAVRSSFCVCSAWKDFLISDSFMALNKLRIQLLVYSLSLDLSGSFWIFFFCGGGRDWQSHLHLPPLQLLQRTKQCSLGWSLPDTVHLRTL